MKKTLKYLLSDLLDELGEYDYYLMLGNLKEANLSIDDLKSKLVRLIEIGKLANVELANDREWGYRETLNNGIEELGLEGIDVDEDDWDSLEEYFDNIKIDESNLDILHDRLEVALDDEYKVERLLEGFEKIEDLGIREEKMKECVTILEEERTKRDSAVYEANSAFRQVTSDIEKKLKEYVEQN